MHEQLLPAFSAWITTPVYAVSGTEPGVTAGTKSKPFLPISLLSLWSSKRLRTLKSGQATSFHFTYWVGEQTDKYGDWIKVAILILRVISTLSRADHSAYIIYVIMVCRSIDFAHFFKSFFPTETEGAEALLGFEQ